MPDHGTVYWDNHAANPEAPLGHQRDAGEGELIGFLSDDDHGHPCGVVETPDGEFLCIRLALLKRSL